MRLLALKADGIVLPAIHDSMVGAFRSLGMEVEVIPVWKVLRASSPSDFLKGFQTAIILDAGVVRDFTSILPDLQSSLRIPWIVWFLDDPEGYYFPDCCYPDYTIPFCWDAHISAEINGSHSWKGRPVAHLPLATDPSLFFPESLPCAYPGGCFVGSTAHSNPFLEEAAQDAGLRSAAEEIWKIYREDFTQSLHTLAWSSLANMTARPVHMLRQNALGRLWFQALLFRVGAKKKGGAGFDFNRPRRGHMGEQRMAESSGQQELL